MSNCDEDFSEFTTIYRTHIAFRNTSETPNTLSPLANIGQEIETNTYMNTEFPLNTALEAVDDAADAQLRDVLLLPDDNTDKPYRLKHCGDLFVLRIHRNGLNKEDIDQCVSAYQLAMRLPQQANAFMLCQYSAALSMLDRFKMTSVMTDINDAISLLESVANRIPDENFTKASRLNILGSAQLQRFQYTGSMEDLNNAIRNHNRSVELTDEGHEKMPSWLNNLGSSLDERFCTSGNMDDITSAISYRQKALKLVDEKSPMAASLHCNLGNSFSHRHQHSGDLSDISNAILHGQHSVYLTAEGNHKLLAGRLNNLANSYMTRYANTNDMSDLLSAISSQHKAIDLNAEGSGLVKSGHLNNIGFMYRRLFQRKKNLKDIEHAISSQQMAISLAPKSHTYLPAMYANLSHSYQSRFTVTDDLQDISNAVINAEKAVELTPVNHSDLSSRLNSLGNAYSRRFERTGNADDLSNCVICHERAVQSSPDDHLDRTTWLNSLGKAYFRRYEDTKDPSDLNLAISHYLGAATNIFGVPSSRLQSSQVAARISQARAKDTRRSFEAFRIAMNLISRVAGLDQTVQKRHTNLGNISTATTEAAATAFSLGEYRTALEWLEQGRCLVWNQLNQLRTPLDELIAHDEGLANRLLRISTHLENLGYQKEMDASTGQRINTMESISLEEQSKERIKLAKDWDSILSEVRQIPKFKNFLQPRGADDLMNNLPKMGFVVVINVHEDRCDALILYSGGEPVHVPLEDFSYHEAEALRSQLHTALKLNDVRLRDAVDRGTFRMEFDNDPGENSVQNVLSELWKWVAHPILSHIYAIQPFAKIRSRIWWCSTGPLAFLPLHAAGIYSEGLRSLTSVPSVSISSYIPTVSYLVDCNSQGRRACHRFLLVSQPNTPNLPAIPGTRQEVEFVKESIEAADGFIQNHLDGSQATIDTVKKEMIQYPWIHLACHAIQNTTSPLQSGFYLHDGCLELGDIIKLQIPDADCAFLSACQTSTGDEKLSEEAVHLAAGMLAAGYKSVVSTMWSISDAHGPQLANDFYKSLFNYQNKVGHGGISGAAAAYALDYSIRRIRAEVKDTESGLLQWVPYVHFGV